MGLISTVNFSSKEKLITSINNFWCTKRYLSELYKFLILLGFLGHLENLFKYPANEVFDNANRGDLVLFLSHNKDGTN